MNDWAFTLFDPGSFTVPKRDVTRVWLHQTCWDNCAFRGITLAEELHKWHLAEGWNGICWHYIVDKDGNIATGRSVEEVPVLHNSPANYGALVIATHGLWHFTGRQLRSLFVLCRCIDQAFRLERKRVTFHSVYEIMNIPVPNFDHRLLLGLDGDGAMFDSTTDMSEEAASRATLYIPLGVRDDTLHGTQADARGDSVSSEHGEEVAR